MENQTLTGNVKKAVSGTRKALHYVFQILNFFVAIPAMVGVVVYASNLKYDKLNVDWRKELIALLCTSTISMVYCLISFVLTRSNSSGGKRAIQKIMHILVGIALIISAGYAASYLGDVKALNLCSAEILIPRPQESVTISYNCAALGAGVGFAFLSAIFNFFSAITA